MNFKPRCAVGLATALLWGLQAFAQAPPTPPPNGDAQKPPPQGIPGGLVGQPKMLAPLPPPPPDAAPPSPDPRLLEGIWLAEPLAFFGAPSFATDNLTPQALKKRQYSEDMNRKGTPLASDAARCRPMNNIGVGADLFPAEIIQTPKQIVVLQEEGRGRWIIHLDRQHPKNLKPSFWGDSIGRWEGDTLVVDTIGFSGEAQDTTKTTHVISRLRKSEGGNKLELKITTEDPQTYLKPVTRTTVSHWHPELQVLEFQCEENPTGAMEGLKAE